MDEHVRAADDDRRQVVAGLERAHSEGRIDLGEFDERTRQTWQAKTYGELAAITADLPKENPRPVPEAATRRSWHAPEPVRRAAGPVHRRNPVVSWAIAVTVNLVIWAVVSLAHHDFAYPWWLWVAGPWGLVLLARYFSTGTATRADRTGNATPS